MRPVLTAVIALSATSVTLAFDPAVHGAITDQVLAEFGFRAFARLEITHANECIDRGPNLAGNTYCIPNPSSVIHWYDWIKAQRKPEFHFDDERISAGIGNLNDLRKDIADALGAGNYALARKKIGAATHAIQDFYSHTNWVELGQRVPFEDPSGQLRFSLDSEAPPPAIRISGDRPTCISPDPNLVNFTDDTRNLTPGASRGGRDLTSGHFFNDDKPYGRCAHGAALEGIHKDVPDSYHGRIQDPGESETYYEIALRLAIDHTRQFLREILAPPYKPEISLVLRSTLFEVHADRLNPIPAPVTQGETWVFLAPRLPAGIPPQEITFAGPKFKAGPSGARNAPNTDRTRFLPNENTAALIGKIEPCRGGTGAADCTPRYFPIGDGDAVVMPASGALSLLVNDTAASDNAGSFWVEYTLCSDPRERCPIEAIARNLIQNPSFEQGPDPRAFTNHPSGSSAINAWQVTGEGIDYIGPLWAASDGARSIDLDGSAPSRAAPPYAIGGVSQVIPTRPGAVYEVSFDLAGNTYGGPSVKAMLVSAAGQSRAFRFDITGKSPANMGWTRTAWTFTSDNLLATVEFRSLSAAPATGWGAAIDNVAVREVDSVPLAFTPRLQ